jgi:hypothetical protein
MTTYAKFGLPALFIAGLLTPGCTILGVEPDEIDVAVDESGETGLSNGGDGDGDTNGTDTADDATTDPSTGDGDGDPGDGDGDGDGDNESTGDGDGDGEPGDGDGDGDEDEVPCAMYEPIVVEEAANAIDIPDVMSSFEGMCGAPGPDAVFSFTATSDATYEFTLGSDAFEGVLYLVDGVCDPLVEIECAPEDQPIPHDMLAGEVVYIIVDSSTGPGAATLTVSAI